MDKKEELFGGLIALMLIAFMWSIFYIVAEHDKHQKELFVKYPECITAGNPYVCIGVKERMEE